MSAPRVGGPAATEPRTLAPAERRTASISANEEVGAYRLLRVRDEHGPSDPRPGQFYMLATAARWGGGGERPYLPRAFSYARARPAAAGVELDFLLEAIGPGTERLAMAAPGEELGLVGPLGRGFRASEKSPLLVGGGIGVAPLLCLADELDGPSVLLGFRSAAHARAADLFDAAPALTTDDGSAGRAGLVTDLLAERLEADPEAAVFACGPPPMLEAVRALCAKLGVSAQLALESGMACGFGACFGCVVRTRAGYVRLCLEGPVLAAEDLDTALQG